MAKHSQNKKIKKSWIAKQMKGTKLLRQVNNVAFKIQRKKKSI